MISVIAKVRKDDLVRKCAVHARTRNFSSTLCLQLCVNDIAGDSGGPLFDSNMKQIGVVSYGRCLSCKLQLSFVSVAGL